MPLMLLGLLVAWLGLAIACGGLAAAWIGEGYRRDLQWPDGSLTTEDDDDDLPALPRSRRDAPVGTLLPLSRRGGDL